MNFAQRLDALMKSCNITTSRLSKETGISKSSLHGYANGADASMANLIKLAEFFDTTIDFLVLGKDHKTAEELMKIAIHEGLYEVTVKKVLKKHE